MDERIRKVLNYVESNLSLKHTSSELAEYAFMSESHFHKVFKKETGRTPLKFVQEIKLSKAHQLLLTENVTVAHLTEQLGYSDYETFSRAFKKHHGIAPADLRAIASKLKTDLQTPPENIVIQVCQLPDNYTSEDLFTQLKRKLTSILGENKYSVDEILASKLFFITNSETSRKDTVRIKNKFELSEHPRIWEHLVNLTSDET